MKIRSWNDVPWIPSPSPLFGSTDSGCGGLGGWFTRFVRDGVMWSVGAVFAFRLLPCSGVLFTEWKFALCLIGVVMLCTDGWWLMAWWPNVLRYDFVVARWWMCFERVSFKIGTREKQRLTCILAYLNLSHIFFWLLTRERSRVQTRVLSHFLRRNLSCL